MVVRFSVKDIPGADEQYYVLVEFQLERPLRPEDLKTIKPPEVHGRVVLLSGRGPIWLYAVLLHEYLHKAKAVAVYDPKIPGYVVVASHVPEHRVGDVIVVGWS